MSYQPNQYPRLVTGSTTPTENMDMASLTSKQIELLEKFQKFLLAESGNADTAPCKEARRQQDYKSMADAVSTLLRPKLVVEEPPLLCMQLFIANTPLQNGLTGSTQSWIEHQLKKEEVVAAELPTEYFDAGTASSPLPDTLNGPFIKSQDPPTYENKIRTRRSRLDSGGVTTLPQEIVFRANWGTSRSNIIHAKSA